MFNYLPPWNHKHLAYRSMAGQKRGRPPLSLLGVTQSCTNGLYLLGRVRPLMMTMSITLLRITRDVLVTAAFVTT